MENEIYMLPVTVYDHIYEILIKHAIQILAQSGLVKADSDELQIPRSSFPSHTALNDEVR